MAHTRSVARLLLLSLPFIWQIGFCAFANGVAWQPFGLPFQLVWQMTGVLIASTAIGIAFRMDEHAPDRVDSEPQP